MAERQVLFRLDEETLEKLDRKLAQLGYRTRNAWFREAVEAVLAGRKAGAEAPPEPSGALMD